MLSIPSPDSVFILLVSIFISKPHNSTPVLRQKEMQEVLLPEILVLLPEIL